MPATPMFGLVARLIGAGIAEATEDDLEDQTVSVDSSCINSIGWRSDGVIIVDFKRGGTYSYSGTKELFDAFVAAPSKGAFFNSHFS